MPFDVLVPKYKRMKPLFRYTEPDIEMRSTWTHTSTNLLGPRIGHRHAHTTRRAHHCTAADAGTRHGHRAVRVAVRAAQAVDDLPRSLPQRADPVAHAGRGVAHSGGNHRGGPRVDGDAFRGR